MKNFNHPENQTQSGIKPTISSIEYFYETISYDNDRLNGLYQRLIQLIEKFNGCYSVSSDDGVEKQKEPCGLSEHINIKLKQIDINLSYMSDSITQLENII